MENPQKKTLGRRKIAIKKIEKKSSLQVAFTKRRGGLFRKASELSVLCGVEIAILVKSPAGKLYSFGHPSVEALINPSPSRLSSNPLPIDHEQPCSSSSSNLMAAAAPPPSLLQLVAADDFVIAADSFNFDQEEEETQLADYQNYYHILGA